MDFSVSVSTEQLFAGAEQLRAMGEDCAGGRAATDDSSNLASTREAGIDDSTLGLRTASNSVTNAYRAALSQACETVSATADALRATARDYQQVEDEVVELIVRLQSEGELA